MDFLLIHYNWIKALHIMAAIAWMAGLFYLPRLFVYHTQSKIGTEEYQRFITMEQKLIRIIMNPAMIATWVFGLIAALLMNYWLDLWFLIKMFLAVCMTAVHIHDAIYARHFKNGTNRRSERFFRFWNEAPTLLMIVIVLLAVIKPA